MRMLAMAIAAVAVVGCTSSGTHYDRAETRGDYGYYDVRLDQNRYRVEYRTDYEDPRLAQDFAMRRAAELTLNGGYHWFQVINRNRAFSDDFFGRYDTYRYDYRNDQYRDRPAYYNNEYSDTALAVIEVVMGYDPPPRGASIYDARRVLDYTSDYRRDYTQRYYYQRRY